MTSRPKITILSGAGISAESGVRTFRDSHGLWEGFDVMEVASPHGWSKNPALVLDFYNQRRRQVLEVSPNKAHLDLAKLQASAEVTIITQNVDDLHERAGSKHVIHLHGELLKVRSEKDPTLNYSWRDDLTIGQLAEDGAQLRPDIVWFGEPVPKIGLAAKEVSRADYLVIVGTSLQVYPAAGLLGYASSNTHVYYIDPNPGDFHGMLHPDQVTVITRVATQGIEAAINLIFNDKKK